MFMDEKGLYQALCDNAYTRTSGTGAEKRCAEYISSACRSLGLNAEIQGFPVRMYKEKTAYIAFDESEIKCKSVLGTYGGEASGEVYILYGNDEISLSHCKNKIVLCLAAFKDMYNVLYQRGAVGIVTVCGQIHRQNRDIDTKYMGTVRDEGNCIPMVTIHIKDAYRLVKSGVKFCRMKVEISEYEGTSQNVVLDIKGESDEVVLACAHYDSTRLSKGVFDNMTGSCALLYLAEYFKDKTPKRTLRLLWCGSEETGLVGSRAYCKYNAHELKRVVLNINLDMLGCVMGGFTCFSCADEAMEEYLKKLCARHDFESAVKLAIRSSDSNSFVYENIPAVSFARYGAGDSGLIHTRYDDLDAVSSRTLLKDCQFVAAFTENAVNVTGDFPRNLVICNKIREDVQNYMKNKLPVL